MATDLPDPSSLKTWEDAFQYPIPTVHRLEQQLRQDLSVSRERLRNLVGASYRDLLGTAEMIIEMHGDVRRVDDNLAHISEKCNSRVFENAGRNFKDWDCRVKASDQRQFMLESLLRLLESCPVVMSRILRKRGSVLLAAKVLVLSRLLHKVLSQSPESSPAIETIRSQLATLRSRLLRYIDRRLGSVEGETSDLVEAMWAFSMATSSSTSDVLKHFHHVRLEAMNARLESSGGDHSRILSALRLYARTLQDTQDVFPKRLADKLSSIKARSLLKDAELRAVVELNLDFYEQWLPGEIRSFTPWIRHDDLQAKDTRNQLEQWADHAFSTLIHGLRAQLSIVEDFRILIQTRNDLLTSWFEVKSEVKDSASGDRLEKIRMAANDRIVQLVHAKARRLHLVVTEISAVLQDRRSGARDVRHELWNLSVRSMDMENGAKMLRQSVVDRSHGRSDGVRRVMNSYSAWLSFIEEVTGVIKEMKDRRWDEDLDEEEDDDGLASRNTLLSQVDPEMVQHELKDGLGKAFGELQETINGNITGIGPEGYDQATFLLRVSREIRSRMPAQCEMKGFGMAMVPRLHEMVAHGTLVVPMKDYSSRLESSTSGIVTRALWEGSPPLPVQPSPGTFQLLYGMINAMAQQGQDLWSPDARTALKVVVRGQVANQMEDLTRRFTEELQTESVPDKKVDLSRSESKDKAGSDDTPVESKEDEKAAGQQTTLVQSLYDVLLLQMAFAWPKTGTDEDVLDRLEGSLRKRVDASEERLRKSATEYWKRTHLLFDLLT
ncbi:MAG: hypothetical protein M1817_006637 [Caeruleum heppii]|nr:MAG: hypothetical protein M1817_006637 [Caeruleum heppii]